MDPKQAALQFKTQLEGTGVYQVTPDGQVQFTQARGGGFVPPWVWSQDLHEQVPMNWKIPASDPSSAWRSSVGYDAGGPFTNHSAWDSSKGTYEGGVDWGTLLGTLGAGSLIGGGALAAFGGGGAAGAGGSAAAGSASAAPAAAGTGAGVGAGGVMSGLPGAMATLPSVGGAGAGAAASASPLMKALAGVGGLVGGNIAGRIGANGAVPSQLTDLLNTMQQRTQAQTPIFNAVQQGTWTGLPNYATQGLTPPKAI